LDAVGWLDRVLEAYRREDWEQALALCEQSLTQFSNDIELQHRKGLCHLALDDQSEAIVAFEDTAARGHLDSHYQLGMIAIRKGSRRVELRAEATGHFEAILQAVAAGQKYAELDRVCFALGNQYGEDPQRRQDAIKMYRQGLALNPLSAVGHNSLGQHLLQSRQVLGAMGEFKVAIQLDPDLNPAYANLAKLFLRHVKPTELEQEYQHIAEEFEESAAQVLSRLSLEMVELGKEQIYEGFCTKGHRIKNLMGIFGSRLRGLGRKTKGDLQKELNRLGGEHQALYDEWVGFLDAMKMEKIRPVVVELERLARRVAELVRSQTWKSEIQVRVQEGLPRVEADERMLREAVVNLCLNALEILEEGDGGQVVLGVGYDEERALVFLEVEDNGPGIDEEYLELVFEPGFTTRERGNGYGLSIARRIAQAHHGALRVKSRKGHGSVFRLDLPLNFASNEN
jgi:signal transduction histidine kinase